MMPLQRISAITAKEFLQLRRDRMTFGMVIMIPLIQLLLFGYAINTMVRDIPIAVVDLSGTAVARLITEEVRVTQVVDIIAHYATAQQAEDAIIAGKVRAALLFPHDLDQRLASGRPAGQWLVDASDTMVSSAILPLRSMPLAGLLEATTGAAVVQQTPTFEVALFFNPERRSEVNIVPGLTAVILTMTMILFTSLALVKERERGNLELLITTPIQPLELMVGKLVPYILVGLIQVVIVLGLGFTVFGVPMNGSYGSLLVITVVFIAASLALGLLISTIARTQLQAMQMTVFILMPSILLSGFVFPFEAMPTPAQYVAEILPATHYVRLIRGVVLRGADFTALLQDITWLAGFTLVILTIAARRFNKTLD